MFILFSMTLEQISSTFCVTFISVLFAFFFSKSDRSRLIDRQAFLIMTQAIHAFLMCFPSNFVSNSCSTTRRFLPKFFYRFWWVLRTGHLQLLVSAMICLPTPPPLLNSIYIVFGTCCVFTYHHIITMITSVSNEIRQFTPSFSTNTHKAHSILIANIVQVL